MTLLDTYYRLEEEIPAERSLSRRPFWTVLQKDHQPFRCGDLVEAKRLLRGLLAAKRVVRLVRVTEELVSVATVEE